MEREITNNVDYVMPKSDIIIRNIYLLLQGAYIVLRSSSHVFLIPNDVELTLQFPLVFYHDTNDTGILDNQNFYREFDGEGPLTTHTHTQTM